MINNVHYYLLYNSFFHHGTILSLQNNLCNERITITKLLVDFIDKKKQNQKCLIQELEAQNVEFVSKIKII